jgi:hypothetical protein
LCLRYKLQEMYKFSDSFLDCFPNSRCLLN